MFQEKFENLVHYGSGFEVDDVYRVKLSVYELDEVKTHVECALCQDTLAAEESYGTEFVIGSARKLLFALPGDVPQRVCGGCVFVHGGTDGEAVEDDVQSDGESSGDFLEAA